MAVKLAHINRVHGGLCVHAKSLAKIGGGGWMASRHHRRERV